MGEREYGRGDENSAESSLADFVVTENKVNLHLITSPGRDNYIASRDRHILFNLGN